MVYVTFHLNLSFLFFYIGNFLYNHPVPIIISIIVLMRCALCNQSNCLPIHLYLILSHKLLLSHPSN